MRIVKHVGGFVCVLAGTLLLAGPASAGIETWPFNSDPGGWTYSTGTVGSVANWNWTLGNSKNEGGWQAFHSPTDTAGAGAYLTSPLLVIDNVGQDYVRMEVMHRWNFPTATNPDSLGQIQYQVNGGGWLGIPTIAFDNDANHFPPTYPVSAGTLPSPFIPTSGTSILQAFAGTSPGFEDPDPTKPVNHVNSTFTLGFSDFGLAPGQLIEFRFLMGPQTAGPDPAVVNWELNKVQIDGVNPVPEPGGIVIAATGLLVGLWSSRQRLARRFLRKESGATADGRPAVPCP